MYIRKKFLGSIKARDGSYKMGVGIKIGMA